LKDAQNDSWIGLQPRAVPFKCEQLVCMQCDFNGAFQTEIAESSAHQELDLIGCRRGNSIDKRYRGGHAKLAHNVLRFSLRRLSLDGSLPKAQVRAARRLKCDANAATIAPNGFNLNCEVTWAGGLKRAGSLQSQGNDLADFPAFPGKKISTTGAYVGNMTLPWCGTFPMDGSECRRFATLRALTIDKWQTVPAPR
jgi:hypothetical protein